MPWRQLDISNTSYDSDDLKNLTWAEVAILESDMKDKHWIRTHCPNLFRRVEEDIRKGKFDPNKNLAETKQYFEGIVGREVPGSEDPTTTWLDCEDKLIEQQLKKDD